MLHSTHAPTEYPIFTTPNPTPPPTTSPSPSPAPGPTYLPTKPPTAIPTLSPTSNPSSNPTSNPTFNLSMNPSSNPSWDPSLVPTQSNILQIDNSKQTTTIPDGMVIISTTVFPQNDTVKKESNVNDSIFGTFFNDPSLFIYLICAIIIFCLALAVLLYAITICKMRRERIKEIYDSFELEKVPTSTEMKLNVNSKSVQNDVDVQQAKQGNYLNSLDHELDDENIMSGITAGDINETEKSFSESFEVINTIKITANGGHIDNSLESTGINLAPNDEQRNSDADDKILRLNTAGGDMDISSSESSASLDIIKTTNVSAKHIDDNDAILTIC